MAKLGKTSAQDKLPSLEETGANLRKQAAEGNKALQAVTPKVKADAYKGLTIKPMKVKHNFDKRDSPSPWR